jgi:hypothetical protein
MSNIIDTLTSGRIGSGCQIFFPPRGLIDLRSTKVAAYILAAGVYAAICLTVVRADRFWIAQALIAALVVAEVTDGVIKVVLYRRGT